MVCARKQRPVYVLQNIISCSAFGFREESQQRDDKAVLTCASSKPDRVRRGCKAATEAAVARTPTAAASPLTYVIWNARAKHVDQV